MYDVTQDFQNKMITQTRRLYGKVQIDYTDPFLDQSILIEPSESANVSYPAQTADGVQTPAGKFASFDGTWVLGEGWVLAPSESEARSHQMGWWGSQLAGTGGAFSAPYPSLTASFFLRPIRELRVVGDSAREEYPVDFILVLYGEEDAVLHTETVTGNTEIVWEKEIESVSSVVKMTLTISKWSHEGRQAKILEFITSIQEIYEGDDILLIHLLEEKEVSRGSLPVGNISSNEIDIRLYNRNRIFETENVNSPLYGLLRANRRIQSWLGIQGELVPLGTHWSGDWDVPEDDIYVQTTGRDRLELLRQSTYSDSEVQEDVTLYDLALDILQDAGVPAANYWVDTELQNFAVPYAYFESQSHREALRKIAEACLGQCYCSRNDVLRIEGPSYAPVTEPLSITKDDYFRKSNPSKWSEIANYIEVETQPLKPSANAEEVYRSNEPVSILAGGEKTLTVFYNHTPCIEALATLEGDGTIDSATYYSWGASVTVSSDTTGEFTVVVNAKKLEVTNKEKVIAQDATSIRENGKLTYQFPKNPLIQTRAVAQVIADKLLAYYKDPRRDVEIEWRGNPAVLLGDGVAIEDSYVTGNYNVVKQELEFDGALRANLAGRKVV